MASRKLVRSVHVFSGSASVCSKAVEFFGAVAMRTTWVLVASGIMALVVEVLAK